MAVASALSAQELSFHLPNRLPVGQRPTDLVIVDLNADGRREVVALNGFESTITTLFNHGGGQFSVGRRNGTGARGHDLATADFNGDGRPDLLVTAFDLRTVLLGRGGSLFDVTQPFLPQPAGHSAEGSAVADFNGDGKLDVAAGAYSGPLCLSSYVDILLGDGVGGFNPASRTSTQKCRPLHLAAADFNADGKTDLAVSAGITQSGAAEIYLGDGAGGLTLAQVVALDRPGDLAAGHLDADGRMDLVVAGSREVAVLFGNGTGPFGQPAFYGPARFTRALDVGDVNSDGRLDIVTASDSRLEVFLADGPQSFRFGGAYGPGGGPSGVALAELSGDGRLDAVTVNLVSEDVAFLPGDGSGGFPTAAPITITPPFPGVLSSGDMDADGRPDAVLALRDGIWLFRGNGLTVNGPTQSPGVSPYHNGPSVVTADVNLDGLLDLVSYDITANGDTVRSALNNTQGGFELGPRAELEVGITLAVGQLDADGNPDVAVGSRASCSIGVLRGDGLGAFGAPAYHPLFNACSFGGWTAVATGDFNGDGRTDLAAGAWEAAGDRGLFVLRGDGSGSFSAPQRQEISRSPLRIVTGDWNGDGHLDVAGIASVEGDYSLFGSLGNGQGGLAPPVFYELGPRGGFPNDIEVADLDRDGRLDLALPGDGLLVFRGRADGTFGPPLFFPGPTAAHHLSIEDFNGDGKPDVVAFDGFGWDLFFFLNTTATAEDHETYK